MSADRGSEGKMHPQDGMIIALIHWRIKLDEDSEKAFLKHWGTKNRIKKRKGLIGEFLSEAVPASILPYTTWNFDEELKGDFKSYVTVGLWAKEKNFHKQVAQYFNDKNSLFGFEKYRRRRVMIKPVKRRIGNAPMPTGNYPGVK